jgi:hypothetical protein
MSWLTGSRGADRVPNATERCARRASPTAMRLAQCHLRAQYCRAWHRPPAFPPSLQQGWFASARPWYD